MSPSPPAQADQSVPAITYAASLQPLSNSRQPTSVGRFRVREYRAGGWVGEAVVNPAPGAANRNIVFEAFRDALADGMVPGDAVLLFVIASGDPEWGPGGAMLARAWPSVVRRLLVEPSADAVGNSIYKVEICDPVTYLADRPIWGVYHQESLGHVIGGVLSLAAGGDGEPTLTPALPDLPTLRIEPHLRPPAGRGAASASSADAPSDYPLRYVVAVGEPLGLWLGKTLSRLGVRMEIEALPEGELCLHLRDGLPAGQPLLMTFGAGGDASETNATLDSLDAFPGYASRAALQDNPSSELRRIGAAGAIGQVMTAAGLDMDEVAERAAFAADAYGLAERTLRVASKQTLIRPGWRIEFANRNVDGTNAWQIADVLHYFGSGGYHNLSYLQKDGEAWRPLIPADEGPVVVSATVDDGESRRGEPVQRDRLGRIPMRFGFLPSAAADPSGGDAAVAPATTPTVPCVPLPVIELMGGGQHGFVPAHRQGDLCRVLVHNPFFAEIYGFAYRDDRRVGADLADVSTGLVVRHDADGFAGLLFRPDEDLADLRESPDDPPGSGTA